MLDTYLEGLAEEQKEKTAAQAAFGPASIPELAKLAGIKLAENVCSACGNTMEKSGSIYKCGCGGMKKAGSMQKTALMKLSAEHQVGYTIRLLEATGGDLEKTAAILELQGMDKEAVGALLRAVGRTATNVGRSVGRGDFARAGKVLKSAPKAIAAGGRKTMESARQYGRGLKDQFGKARDAAGAWSKPAAGSGAQTFTRGGVMSGLKGVAKQNPGLAAGAAGGAGLALGAGGMAMMRPKQKAAAAEALFEVGDAAGRILAKTAAFDTAELQESIGEARDREDVAGRSKRWQIGGGIGGGAAGGLAGAGLGAGAAHLLGGKGRLLGAGIGGALGAAGGATAGQHFGKQHGAEEAMADKTISMLRALRARNMGMRTGIQSGARAGYMAGMRRGSMMGGQQKTSSVRDIINQIR